MGLPVLRLKVCLVVSVPLVCDMTNTLLTKEINWSLYNCVFAAVYPNICTNGNVIVIARKSAIKTKPKTPLMADYSLFMVP